MPRIDPLQLLNCLQVLLSPTTGGILSNNEVQRLASLMTKFSKKLVSKCVYILILKNTEKQLLGNFMAVGGWTLLQVWLHDAMCNSNWALVKELLELVLITPVDVERLKSNNIPKLVKSLSKREELDGIFELSNKLVQQWLKIVKQETSVDIVNQQLHHYQPLQQQQQLLQQKETKHTTNGNDTEPPPFEVVDVPVVQVDHTTDETIEEIDHVDSAVFDEQAIDTQTFYKLSVRDGKQVLSKVNRSEANCTVVENAIIEEVDVNGQPKVEEEDVKEKENREEKKKDRNEKGSTSSKSGDKYKSSSSSKDSQRSKDRDRHKSNRDRDRSHRDKRDSKHRHNGQIKSSSSSNHKSSSSKDKERKESSRKDTKEKQAEKDKDTLAKVQPQSVTKLPKIPKKASEGSSDNSKDAKKGSISIEIRKTEERPKTVKVFNAKMRSTGLEEEVKPPPPRPTKKPTTSLPTIPSHPVHKKLSPTRDILPPPPEKKSKIESAERPGAIKLIPPKPKPAFLQESDMFMDALTASASSKKEPKKRRRRPSTSKDSSSPPISPSTTQAATVNTETTSPMALRNITPPKFYKDTLEAEDEDESIKEGDKENLNTPKDEEMTKDEIIEPSTPTDAKQEMEVDEDKHNKDENGLKGVLVYTKRKGPKKSIRWKSDEDLVQIQYFELDENERVNVTKAFGDMAKLDVKGEREALQMCRKLQNEDLMDVHTQWRIPWEIELEKSLADPGSKSLEKEVQFAREKSVLQALYFHKTMIPDSPAEPDPENYQVTDPVIIPIEAPDDPDHDYRNTPWPEPKGSPPPQSLPNIPQVFPKVANNFQNFGIAPPPSLQNMPIQQQPQAPFGGPPTGFIPPNVLPPGEWNMPNNINNQVLVPNVPPPDIINQGPMNPNLGFAPGPLGPGAVPDNFNHHPLLKDNNINFPPPLFNQPRMFPPNHPNFRGGHDHHGAHRGFRRGGGTGPWVRMNGPNPGNWNHVRGGHRGGHMPTRLCKNVRQHGYCRNRDNCLFFHPN
ncbi:serine/threonine-protein phosphatase 1 regulatory subunit 10 [Agrilus planipennis]|uniref:Serine/threonine-protein phosphatase 1 regulatory subunit 10 n=1 Tax=Agrilus planipennis TaxID=224129 RepID=A0A1W4WEL1_AGRPL|nr:serine/threonine-protein phosphatase 1 regulatory subunit 10 [Agrilus planipennis]